MLVTLFHFKLVTSFRPLNMINKKIDAQISRLSRNNLFYQINEYEQNNRLKKFKFNN